MAYWTRVTVQDGTETQTGTGNPRLTWTDVLENVEARAMPLTTDEQQERWATPEEDAYEVHLRHGALGIRPRMRVIIDGEAYDIRKVIEPPPFGTPTTILQCVKVTP